MSVLTLFTGDGSVAVCKMFWKTLVGLCSTEKTGVLWKGDLVVHVLEWETREQGKAVLGHRLHK